MSDPMKNLPATNLTGCRSWSAAVSPSNLALATLVGFLFVGQATDWKILFGRKSTANSSMKFGTLDSARKRTQMASQVRSGSARGSSIMTDPKSEVADRRPAANEVRNGERELD